MDRLVDTLMAEAADLRHLNTQLSLLSLYLAATILNQPSITTLPADAFYQDLLRGARFWPPAYRNTTANITLILPELIVMLRALMNSPNQHLPPS